MDKRNKMKEKKRNRENVHGQGRAGQGEELRGLTSVWWKYRNVIRKENVYNTYVAECKGKKRERVMLSGDKVVSQHYAELKVNRRQGMERRENKDSAGQNRIKERTRIIPAWAGLGNQGRAGQGGARRDRMGTHGLDRLWQDRHGQGKESDKVVVQLANR